MNKVVVVQLGATSEKKVNGERKKVTPFVGIEGEGDCAKLGIGILFEGNTPIFWGLVIPHALIQSWRGMKILEQTSTINTNETLCACWIVAKNNIYNTTNHYIEMLSHSFGGVKKLEKTRYEMIDTFPTADELENMITTLRSHDVSIDVREVEEGIRLGRVQSTPFLEEVTSRNSRQLAGAVLNLACN